jgi:hypothetical protein
MEIYRKSFRPKWSFEKSIPEEVDDGQRLEDDDGGEGASRVDLGSDVESDAVRRRPVRQEGLLRHQESEDEPASGVGESQEAVHLLRDAVQDGLAQVPAQDQEPKDQLEPIL